jgi:hypothetical protein
MIDQWHAVLDTPTRMMKGMKGSTLLHECRARNDPQNGRPGVHNRSPSGGGMATRHSQ